MKKLVSEPICLGFRQIQGLAQDAEPRLSRFVFCFARSETRGLFLRSCSPIFDQFSERFIHFAFNCQNRDPNFQANNGKQISLAWLSGGSKINLSFQKPVNQFRTSKNAI